MNLDSNNEVMTDLTKANTTYTVSGTATSMMVMYHFSRNQKTSDSGFDYNITDGEQGLKMFASYGQLKSAVIQEPATYILNNRFNATINLIEVGMSAATLIKATILSFAALSVFMVSV